MPASVSSEPFRALAAALRVGGVVIAIRKECRPLTSDQKALVRECMRQVRKAWPGFGLCR